MRPEDEPLQGVAAGEAASAPSAFIIATRNRPEHLEETVRSVTRQSVLPSELCIVDSSDEAAARDRIEDLCGRAGVRVVYDHPAEPGLPRQRNRGMDLTTGDPVVFVDDDVLLEPTCHAELLAQFERAGPDLGGVTGADSTPPRLPRGSIAWRRLFGSGGWWPDASGRVRSSFFAEGISESSRLREVEFFMGWLMAFRREVFQHERFDEALSGYAYMEDIDLTYRVSRRYRLVRCPTAVGEHLKVQTSRLGRAQVLRMMVGNHFYLHRKHMPQTLRTRLALYWAFFGLLLLNGTRVVRFRDPGHVTGLLRGLWDQVRGRSRLEPPAASAGRRSTAA